MTATLELIEMLRERAHISYEEAREALDKCNGDIVEALIYLEKQDKIKAPQKETCSQSGFWATVKRLVKKCHETRLVISKADDIIIDLPLTVVIIITVFAAPITIIGLLAALFTKHKIRIKRPSGGDLKINKTLDDISSAASKVSDQVVDAINKI
ncbi:MAG TPA: DUF4342 domain-containing protein [Syntrophomonadaceae bacterium]|nr:DUF4342 domain-containing protein [Syntrophomonadaceae bacterium]